MKIFQGYDANFGADEQYPFRRGAGACVPSGNEAARRGRSPAPASVYTKSCPLSSLRGERGKPRHECTKPGGQAVESFARTSSNPQAANHSDCPVCRQSISDSWLGNLRECLAHLVLRIRLRLPADAGGVFARWF